MMSMDGILLAHAGGLDEMAIILFPIVVGGGVWLMTRQPAKKPTPEGGTVSSANREPPPPRQRWGGSGPSG